MTDLHMQPCKVVIITTKYPFPADDGKKVVLNGLIQYFVDRFGADQVSYIAVNDRPQVSTEPDRFPCRLTWVSPPRASQQAISLFQCIVGRSGRSLQEAATYSSQVAQALWQLVNEARPDLLILDTIRMSQYFVDHARPAPRTIVYMDHLLYTRFRAMSRFVADHPDAALDPIGTFRRFVPKLVRRILRAVVLQRWLFNIEAKAVEPREIQSAKVFDTCLLLTQSDVNELRTRCPDRGIYAIKPLIFVSPCRTTRRYDGSPRFILCGSLRHPANRAAFIQFFRQCMEPALTRLPKLEIHVIGAGADDELRAVAQPFGTHVHFDGFVEDLGIAFGSACALLVPLLFGYGLKIKTLAAMYYGLPIISTSEGVESLPLRAGEDFILEDDLKCFPASMERLCDVRYNQTLSERVSESYRRNFARETIYAEYDSIFLSP